MIFASGYGIYFIAPIYGLNCQACIKLDDVCGGMCNIWTIMVYKIMKEYYDEGGNDHPPSNFGGIIPPLNEFYKKITEDGEDYPAELIKNIDDVPWRSGKPQYHLNSERQNIINMYCQLVVQTINSLREKDYEQCVVDIIYGSEDYEEWDCWKNLGKSKTSKIKEGQGEILEEIRGSSSAAGGSRDDV